MLKWLAAAFLAVVVMALGAASAAAAPADDVAAYRGATGSPPVDDLTLAAYLGPSSTPRPVEDLPAPASARFQAAVAEATAVYLRVYRPRSWAAVRAQRARQLAALRRRCRRGCSATAVQAAWYRAYGGSFAGGLAARAGRDLAELLRSRGFLAALRGRSCHAIAEALARHGRAPDQAVALGLARSRGLARAILACLAERPPPGPPPVEPPPPGPGGGGPPPGGGTADAYLQAVLAAGPVAYWRLDDNDETARDSSGQARHGHYYGGPLLRSPRSPAVGLRPTSARPTTAWSRPWPTRGFRGGR